MKVKATAGERISSSELFRRCAVPEPRPAVESLARELLRTLATLNGGSPLRVLETDGRKSCLILVWDATDQMPTIGEERREREREPRVQCKQDILEAIRAAGKPLTHKQLVKAFRETKKGHGVSTVAKALADLTTAGELVNRMDRQGYRLAEWPKPVETPSLFD